MLNNLGYTYKKDNTTWSLWSNNIDKVDLVIFHNENYEKHEFIKNKDFFQINLIGDYKDFGYYYIIYRNNNIYLTLDIYAKQVIYKEITCPYTKLNIKYYNVVVDFSTYKIKSKINYQKNDTAFIYEAHVKDINSNTQDHTFLGIINNKVFINHLKDLKVTHLQLLPINAYLNDKYDVDNYNWGYNPLLFSSLHPTYLKNSVDEFKIMVEELHKNNIGIVIDLVFNHVFDYENNPLEITSPSYYFLHDEDNNITNYSGCGNDIDTSKKMTKHLLIQTVKFFLQEYKVDGFRFDLMGLLELDFINELYDICIKINPNILFYGEGWNMNNTNTKLTTISNAKLTKAGYFNDFYREKLYPLTNGYIDINDLLEIFNGTTHLYNNQSVNYFACHDGLTLFDKVFLDNNKNLSVYDKYTILLTTLFLSKGYIFLQLGDDFLRTKFGHSNSYNEGMFINNVDYNDIIKHKEIKELIINLRSLRELLNINSLSYSIESNHLVLNNKYEIYLNYNTLELNFNKEILYLFDGKIINKKVVKDIKLDNIGFHIFERIDNE